MCKVNSKSIALIAVVLTAGCASSSGPVPIGKDTFMITKQSDTGLASGSAVKAEIFKEGYAFCEEQGLNFQPIGTSHKDGVFGSSYANAEVQFRCLRDGDPELSRPTLEPVPNVRINTD